MRTEPPTGPALDQILERISENVLRRADDGRSFPPAAPAPRARFRLGAVVVSVLVVLGLGTAGSALALGWGSSLWGGDAPAPMTATPAASPRPPTPTPTATAAPRLVVPTVVAPSTTYRPGDWGAGIPVSLSGLAPDTTYTVSLDSRYRGESQTPDGYFSMIESSLLVTTDSSGAVSTTWTPDAFPQNFTESGESGFLLGSYLRVDSSDGPPQDGSPSGFGAPIALSGPLSIEFLPVADVTATAPSCVEPGQLNPDQPGLPMSFTGLLSGEMVFVGGVRSGEEGLVYLTGSGMADVTGATTIVLHGGTAEYPVPTSAEIAPEEWQLRWSANARVAPAEGQPPAYLPLTIGGCG